MKVLKVSSYLFSHSLQVIKEEQVDPISLIASLVMGALKGFALGSAVADSVITSKMEEAAERILRYFFIILSL